MGSEKIFMFGEPSTGGRADLTAILPALMNNNKGIDPNILAMLGNRDGNGRDGFGNDFFAYLDEHGPHFSKKLCEYAVSNMENADGSKHRYSKEEVKELLKRNGVTVKKASEYDCCFVANMAYADFFPEPLRNEFDIAMYVKKYIDDPDGYEGIAFSRYLADLKRTGTYIDWEEMI